MSEDIPRSCRPCIKCGARDRNKSGACKACSRQRGATWRATPEYRAWRDAHTQTPEFRAHRRELAKTPKRRAQARARLRGITLEEHDRLLASQKGLCAACCDPLISGRETHLDHDHATGQVRGFLCLNCNLAEGYMKGSPTRLRALAAYIEKHSQLRFFK